MELKRLLKRGAFIVAANWPTVVIQFAARTTFQALLAVPVIGAAILVAVLLGTDISRLVAGGIRDMAAGVANALLSEPAALTAFGVAFVIALIGATAFMAFVKGGTVAVLVAAEAETGPIEAGPFHLDAVRGAWRVTTSRLTEGGTRHFRRYFAVGLLQLFVYALSGGLALAFLAYGYNSAESGLLFLGWALIATLTAGLGAIWVTMVNLFYLLLQIAIAVDDIGVLPAIAKVSRFIRVEFKSVGGVFLVLLGVVVIAMLASALAWSGVALVAFVPLVGLAVVPLQVAALIVRGLVFEYIGLTGLGAYATLYRRYAERAARATASDAMPSGAVSAAR